MRGSQVAEHTYLHNQPHDSCISISFSYPNLAITNGETHKAPHTIFIDNASTRFLIPLLQQKHTNHPLPQMSPPEYQNTGIEQKCTQQAPVPQLARTDCMEPATYKYRVVVYLFGGVLIEAVCYLAIFSILRGIHTSLGSVVTFFMSSESCSCLGTSGTPT